MRFAGEREYGGGSLCPRLADCRPLMGWGHREEAISLAEGSDAIYSERGLVMDSCVHLDVIVEFWRRTSEVRRSSEGAYKDGLVV